MIVGRWYVQLAAIWHWYLPLCIYITFFYFSIVSVHSFFIFLYPGTDQLARMVDDTACPSLMCSFNKGNIEGTNSLKNFV